ncbi:MAG: hypothetical protein MK052_05625, partial [Alphaproteobacteria bacterium]|nr:hypothetical protein [Alphaproteobacteria bacterium]
KGVNGGFMKAQSIGVRGLTASGMLGAMASLPIVGAAFGKAAKVLKTPSEVAGKATFGNVIHAPSAALGAAGAHAAAYAAGDEKGAKFRVGQEFAGKAAERLSRAGEAAGGVEGQLANTVGSRITSAFSRLEVDDFAQAPRRFLAGHYGGKSESKFKAAAHSLEDVLARDEAKEAHGALGKVAKVLGGSSAEELDGAVKAAYERFEELAKDKNSSINKKVLSDVRKATAEAYAAAGDGMRFGGRASRIENFGDTVRNIPQSVAKTNIADVAVKGAVYTGTALQVTSTARGIADNLHTLKQMHCDITGDKKISTRKLLTSKKVPDVVKRARNQIFKEFGPRAVLNAANIAATVGKKKSGMKYVLVNSGIGMATQMINNVTQASSVLPMYEAMNQAPQLTEMHYAQFLSAASKDANKAGGVESGMVQALATDYAREGVRPADILKEIETGRFDQRTIAKAEANRIGMESKGGHTISGANAQTNVVGEHTRRLQNQGVAPPQPDATAPQLR